MIFSIKHIEIPMATIKNNVPMSVEEKYSGILIESSFEGPINNVVEELVDEVAGERVEVLLADAEKLV